MKFNVFFKKGHGAYWVLTDSSPLCESPLFETRPEAIGDLENFVTLMESPIFIDAGEAVNAGNEENLPPVVVIFKQRKSRWCWELFFSLDGLSSKIAESSDKGFDSLEMAKQKAWFFCNSIIDAPVLDEANVAIPGMHFSKFFADAHHIGDIHPSSKWLK